VGAVIFALTVFPHFSSAHDYYSTPLLAPAAILIALGLAAVSASTARWRTAILALVLLGLVVGSAYAVRRVNFFSRDWQRIRAGEAIAQYTAPGDLVVSATLGRSTGGPDPRILYFANRRGWTIELKDLNPEALDLYRAHGADGVALLITPQHPSTEDQYPILASFPREIVELRDPDGQPIGHLVLFRLNP
jgi:4-amino-4-deoxy-L-arabinose transferase-like glycosyltransferase